MINEKSVSRAQQRLMGQAYAVRKFMDTNGKEGLDPNNIKALYKDIIIDLAKRMTKKQLKDFAETPHKNLPEVKEEECQECKKEKTKKEGVNESFEMKPSNTTIPKIIPYLKPEINKAKKKGKIAKMQNLVDYREFIAKRKISN